LRARYDILHARTFVGGVMGLLLAPVLGARLVYHNEGFYPDEQVDAGIWRAGSLPHRFARFLERRLYCSADGIIALSTGAELQIASLPDVRRKVTPTTVVPSCVDLERFHCLAVPSLGCRDELRLAYLGSIGGRYAFDRAARFAAAASRELGRL